VRLFRVYHKKCIQGGTDIDGKPGGHPVVDILKEAPEGGLDNPMEFVRRW
jgi:hypothetical protein